MCQQPLTRTGKTQRTRSKRLKILLEGRNSPWKLWHGHKKIQVSLYQVWFARNHIPAVRTNTAHSAQQCCLLNMPLAKDRYLRNQAPSGLWCLYYCKIYVSLRKHLSSHINRTVPKYSRKKHGNQRCWGSLWQQNFWILDNKDIFVIGRHKGEGIRCPLSNCNSVSNVPVSDYSWYVPELKPQETVHPKEFYLNEN